MNREELESRITELYQKIESKEKRKEGASEFETRMLNIQIKGYEKEKEGLLAKLGIYLEADKEKTFPPITDHENKKYRQWAVKRIREHWTDAACNTGMRTMRDWTCHMLLTEGLETPLIEGQEESDSTQKNEMLI